MKNRFQTVLSIVLLSTAAAVTGCGEASDEVTNTVSCASVCGRYQECVDSDFDVDGCTDRCEDEADASENREERLQSCDSCIEDRSCVDATVTCSAECAGVI
jgi:hypothetical protein